MKNADIFLLVSVRDVIDAVHRAFGAPGDYGYGTPQGDALFRLYKQRAALQVAIEAAEKPSPYHPRPKGAAERAHKLLIAPGYANLRGPSSLDEPVAEVQVVRVEALNEDERSFLGACLATSIANALPHHPVAALVLLMPGVAGCGRVVRACGEEILRLGRQSASSTDQGSR